MTEAELIQMLRERYSGNDWAFLEQVRNSTGYQRQTRTADALAMGLWPSRGLHLHGFEVKISRSDWLHELKQPAKAEEFHRFCNYWWLVVSDKGFVQEGELPESWGLLAPTKAGKLKAVKAAPLRDDAQEPTRGLLASILRNINRNDPSAEVLKAARQEGIKRGMEKAEDRLRWDVDQEKRKRESLHREIDRFREASGLSLHDATTVLSEIDFAQVVAGFNRQAPLSVYANKLTLGKLLGVLASDGPDVNDGLTEQVSRLLKTARHLVDVLGEMGIEEAA